MTSESSGKSKEGSNSEYGAGHTSLSYNSYLMVDQLKELQVCKSDPAHHDEPLFIIIHQTYELWFKLILHELDTVVSMMRANNPRRATFYMRRIVQIMRVLVNQIHILETMSPKDFLGFRNLLNPASGFQSSQFREVEFMAGLREPRMLEHFAKDEASFKMLQRRFDDPSLGDVFYELLRTHGFTLPPSTGTESGGGPDPNQVARINELKKLYDEPDKYLDFHDLAERLLDLDELILLWRTHHVTVVERIIGFKPGTGGSEGVGYLRSTLNKKCFPDLWQLRTYLTL
ncbi:MAG: tryptophan 2,3-dioxygenase family protein [Candidatus Melainabacteria bacterium]|nr:tryptophan 2,3-dioxygenase family protein [Candidatus Melainabacteria bacterium]